MTLDTIDPRYRRFVVAVEPELTPQQRRDIINSGKKPSTAPPDASKLDRPLTRLERQKVQARARARKAMRRKYEQS